MRDNRFILLEKSNWLIGRVWFQFQVWMGWIVTTQESINSVRSEINRLQDTHEIQQILSSLICDKTSNCNGIIEVLSSIIDKKNKKIIKSKKDLRDIETLKYTLENEEIIPNISEEMTQCRLTYTSRKNKDYKREIETLTTVNRSLAEQISAKDRVIFEQRNHIIEQRSKILEDEEIIEELTQMIDVKKLFKESSSTT